MIVKQVIDLQIVISHVSTTGLSSNNFQGNLMHWLVIPLFCLSLVLQYLSQISMLLMTVCISFAIH